MRANYSKNITKGDILFSVDPQRLLISAIDVIEVKDGYGKVSVHSTEELVLIEKFPVTCHGLLLFKTKDEAEEFIKTQIGI